MKLQEKNKAVAYGSFPSDQREKFKENNKEKIMNHPRFQMAVNIYNKF